MSPTDLPTDGRFDGPEAFAQRVREALQAAADDGWREMVWCDPNFEDWPLRERLVVEHLNAWARSGRQLTLLAHDYSAVRRLHARFVQWRVRWDHLLVCRQCKTVDASEVPSVLWSPLWVLRRVDIARQSGVVETDPRARLRTRESLDALLRKSSPGFPASTLGL